MPELLAPQPMLEEQLQAPFGEPDPSVDGGFLQAEQAYAEIPYEQPDIAPESPTLSQRFAASRIGRTLLGGFVSFGLASGGVAVAASPAHAESSHTYTIENTNGDGVWLHGDPGLGDSGDLLTVVPEGTSVTADCYVNDSPVGKKNNPAWLRITYNGTEGFVSDAFTSSKWNKNNTLHDQGLEFCGEEAAEQTSEAPNLQPAESIPIFTEYDRDRSAGWAKAHAKDTPPNAGSCTWFMSKALWKGGIRETEEWNNNIRGIKRDGIRYGTDIAWGASEFMDYAETLPYVKIHDLESIDGKEKVPEARLGDIMMYDWTGDGIVDHATIITGFSNKNPQYPLVSGWSENEEKALWYEQRGWTWSEKGNDWIVAQYPDTEVQLLHIRTQDEVEANIE